MLPDVGSTIVPPGLSRPRAGVVDHADRRRSFDDPPGLVISALTTTLQGLSLATCFRLTSGVLPIRSNRVESP